jgi:hypothetical protein
MTHKMWISLTVCCVVYIPDWVALVLLSGAEVGIIRNSYHLPHLIGLTVALIMGLRPRGYGGSVPLKQVPLSLP